MIPLLSFSMDQYPFKISGENSKNCRFYSNSKIQIKIVPFLLAHPVPISVSFYSLDKSIMIIFGIGALTFRQSTRIKQRITKLESFIPVLQKCRNRMGNLESKWFIFVVGSQLSDFFKSPEKIC